MDKRTQDSCSGDLLDASDTEFYCAAADANVCMTQMFW
jgi:hypothetical protein